MALTTLLFVLGGFLLGAAWAVRARSVVLAVVLAVCAALAVVSGILRYG